MPRAHPLICLALFSCAQEATPDLLPDRDRLAADLAKFDPKNVDDYSRRGDLRFFLGDFKGAVADYEKMVELQPRLDAEHWRRGIAYFYAGEFEKAAGQFERYHSHDNVDRENGIWRYFSQFKAYGKDKARAGLLKYEKDDREPFPAVYKLFSGALTADQVLAGVESAPADEREMRRFYAHLYVGLNAAMENDLAAARKHLRQAVSNTWGPEAGYGPRYMWHVGRVHYEKIRSQ